jgi:hypothetical protein
VAGPRNIAPACAEVDGVILTGSLEHAAVARLAVSIRDLVARSSRLDRPFDLVHWARACVDDGSDPRQWKPAIAIALLYAPALVAELGVDLGPLRHAGVCRAIALIPRTAPKRWPATTPTVGSGAMTGQPWLII